MEGIELQISSCSKFQMTNTTSAVDLLLKTRTSIRLLVVMHHTVGLSARSLVTEETSPVSYSI
jgi:hypothetical protein